MATLVCFHAHPDDESIITAGLMIRAAARGHRVVLVVATRGEHGEVVPGVLDDGEQLGVRRVAETFAAAEVLGVSRVELLGYVDSEMMGEPENDAPYSFWSVDVDTAAARLAAILVEESADVLTIYDDHGGYGHPDHIQVHRVGARAAQLAGTAHVYEATMNRDAFVEMSAVAFADGAADDLGIEAPTLGDDFGSRRAVITHELDVSDLAETKRKAMQAHPSQIADDSFFLAMPPELFAAAFGTESFIEHGSSNDAGPVLVDLLPGLD